MGSITKFDARPTDMQLKMEATLLTVIVWGHGFISITKENTYQIVFVSFIEFSFNCRSAGMTADKSFSRWPQPLVSGELVDQSYRDVC